MLHLTIGKRVVCSAAKTLSGLFAVSLFLLISTTANANSFRNNETAACAGTANLTQGEQIWLRDNQTFIQLDGSCFSAVLCDGRADTFVRVGGDAIECRPPAAPVCQASPNLAYGEVVQQTADGFARENGQCSQTILCPNNEDPTGDGSGFYRCQPVCTGELLVSDDGTACVCPANTQQAGQYCVSAADPVESTTSVGAPVGCTDFIEEPVAVDSGTEALLVAEGIYADSNSVCYANLSCNAGAFSAPDAQGLVTCGAAQVTNVVADPAIPTGCAVLIPDPISLDLGTQAAIVDANTYADPEGNCYSNLQCNGGEFVDLDNSGIATCQAAQSAPVEVVTVNCPFGQVADQQGQCGCADGRVLWGSICMHPSALCITEGKIWQNGACQTLNFNLFGNGIVAGNNSNAGYIKARGTRRGNATRRKNSGKNSLDRKFGRR